MRLDLKITGLVLTLTGLLWTGPTHARADQQLALEAETASPGAAAEAVITDADGGRKEVTITTSGLQPDAVYTVWLVTMRPKMDMAGLGTGDYSFRTDANGAGRYVATIPGAALERWQALEIAYHPSGDAKNMHEMMGHIVFKARLDN